MSNNKQGLSSLYKPPSDLTQYDEEEYMKNPLLVFRIVEVKQRRHYSWLQRKADEEKVKLGRRRESNLSPVLPVRKEYCVKKLREYVRKIPVPKMLYQTDNKVRSFVPKRLKEKYPELVKSYMDEVNVEFDKMMKAFSLRKILLHPVSDDENDEYIRPCTMNYQYKYLSRTENYHIFLQNREKIKKNLLITVPFIRAILYYSNTDFPEILNDYTRYNDSTKDDMGVQNLSNFVKQSKNDFHNHAHFIKWSWYPKIVHVMKKHFKKRTLSLNMWPKAFRCAKELINRQLNILKIRTLDHLIKVILNPQTIPRIRLYARCETDLDLDPSLEVIEECFCQIAEDIARECANQLEVLEPQISLLAFAHPEEEYLNIGLSKIYMNEYIERLKNSFELTYTPVRRFVEEFQEKYYEVYSEETIRDLDNFLSKPREFEEYFKRISVYNAYIDMLRSEVAREYFEFTIVNKTSAISKLRQKTDDLIAKITKQIVIEHMKEELEICRIFEKIKEKALEIPRSTEQLLDGSDWMIHVKTKEIFDIKDRIQRCLQVGSELMSLVELSADHLKLQIKMINWLQDIYFVFEQNASQHEQYKFIFEEHLQDVTKKLNDDINEMIPNLSVLNDMCDTEKFGDYNILLQNFIDQLKTFDDYIVWINKEEKLFKIPQTQYPTLAALKEFVYPFAELIRLCTKWLRHYYVWMDGPFEYLQPKFVEETTDEYYKDFLKTQKYYRNRIKQDLMGDPVCKFRDDFRVGHVKVVNNTTSLYLNFRSVKYSK